MKRTWSMVLVAALLSPACICSSEKTPEEKAAAEEAKKKAKAKKKKRRKQLRKLTKEVKVREDFTVEAFKSIDHHNLEDKVVEYEKKLGLISDAGAADKGAVVE